MGSSESKPVAATSYTAVTPGEPLDEPATIYEPAFGKCPNPVRWNRIKDLRGPYGILPLYLWTMQIVEIDRLNEQSADLCSILQRRDIMELAQFGTKSHKWAATAAICNNTYDAVVSQIQTWRDTEFDRICVRSAANNALARELIATLAAQLRDLYLAAATARHNRLHDLSEKAATAVAAAATTPN